LNLRTNKIITIRSITEIPITNNIIEMVENLAKIEKMPRGLKINESTENDFEYDQLAGVSDYDLEDHKIAGVQDISDTDSETDENESNESTDVMDPNEIESINKRRTYFDANENEEVINNNNESFTMSEDNKEEESDEEEDSDDEDDETPQLNPDDRIIWNPDGTMSRITRSGRTSKPPIKLSLQQLGVEEKY
jgi:hypothetical protein